MQKILLSVFIALYYILPVNGQELNGQIMNSKQRPLKGLKVWRKNTTESIVTDKLGIFAFSSVLPTDTLVISVFRKEEIVIPVNELSTFSLKLEKNHYLLFDGQNESKNEYKKIARTSYNVNILTREQVAKLSANSIYDLFRGTMPGITVKDGSSGRKISVRGGSGSFEQDTEPLFIVNGTQYSTSSEVDQIISIPDIEQVEVIKEGSGYGVRGANGVIIITLRKNKL